ncbi:bromodomain-containing protein [Sarcoptes scabiei]|uniref:Bromodomain-containing protein n=1 Tax=Sarcoptes scabiei TaxID=52283 RepID=A0A132A1I8_SARSC|nr:bromodomain-containing protein [Sarcoptes scabiei]
MLELTAITFSSINPAIQMKHKYNSSGHYHHHRHFTRRNYLLHMSSPQDNSNEDSSPLMHTSIDETNVNNNIDESLDDDHDDDDSRASSTNTVSEIYLKNGPNLIDPTPKIDLPSPPSSTRSSYDAITKDSFISTAEISEQSDSRPSSLNGSLMMNESNDENLDSEDLMLFEHDDQPAIKTDDDEIKLIIEEIIVNAIDSISDTDSTCVQIDLNGTTILPNGIKIVKGVAQLPFDRSELEDGDHSFQPRFTNQLSFLKTILTKYIIRYKTAMPFMNPVDSVQLKIPHYYHVIRDPMDFNTIKNRLTFLWYRSAEECISDINQIFINCYKFNSPSDYVYSAGKKLQEYIDEKLKEMPEEEEEILCPPKPSLEECKSLLCSLLKFKF